MKARKVNTMPTPEALLEQVAESQPKVSIEPRLGRLRWLANSAQKIVTAPITGLGRLNKWLLESRPVSEAERFESMPTNEVQPTIASVTPNSKTENLKAAVDDHKVAIGRIKEGLSLAYAGEDRLMVGGRDIFASARRQRKKYPEKPEKFVDSISRALLKASTNEEWVAALTLKKPEVQTALSKLKTEQEAIRKDSRALSREKSKEKKRLTNIALQSQTKKAEPAPTLEQNLVLESPPAEVLSRKDKQPEAVDKRPRSAVLRRAAVFGLVAATVAAAFFVKDSPQVSDFLKTMIDTKPRIIQAKEEAVLPPDIKALQKRIDELTESNNAYKAESQERFAQLVEARMAAYKGYIPDQLREIGKKNKQLVKENERLQKQLEEARVVVHPEQRWVDAFDADRLRSGNEPVARTISPQVQAAFAPYGNGGDYALREGDSLAKIAQNIGHVLKLDIGEEGDRKKINQLARSMALDNDIASESLGTTGRSKDTALPIGKVINLRGTIALAAKTVEG